MSAGGGGTGVVAGVVAVPVGSGVSAGAGGGVVCWQWKSACLNLGLVWQSKNLGKPTVGSGRGLRMHSGIGRADIGASGGVTRSTVAGGVWKASPPGTSPSLVRKCCGR